MRRVGLSVLAVVVLATGLWAGMSSAGPLKAAPRGRTEGGPQRSARGATSEGGWLGCPRFLRRDAGAQGYGRDGYLALDLPGSDREGDGGSRAPGGERKAGAGCARPLRPVPQWGTRLGESKCQDRSGPLGRRCVRERAHGDESRRRDSRAGFQGFDGRAASDDYDDDDHRSRRPVSAIRPLMRRRGFFHSGSSASFVSRKRRSASE